MGRGVPHPDQWTLREVGLNGRDRRPPRPVACGAKPVGETPHGLWVTVGPDAFTDATVGSGPEERHYVLLDPATLAEPARFSRVELVDEHRVIVIGNHSREPMELRDLRTGQVYAAGPTPVERLARPPCGVAEPGPPLCSTY